MKSRAMVLRREPFPMWTATSVLMVALLLALASVPARSGTSPAIPAVPPDLPVPAETEHALIFLPGPGGSAFPVVATVASPMADSGVLVTTPLDGGARDAGTAGQ